MILKRYLQQSVVNMIFVSAVAFIGVTFFIDAIGEFHHIGNGTYTLVDAMFYVLMRLPNVIYTIFPIIGLTGCLLALGSLSMNNELTVMRACGLSRRRIIVSVMTMVAIICICACVFFEVVIPSLNQHAKLFQMEKLNNNQALIVGQSFWFKQGLHFIHVQDSQDKAHLRGINEYTFNTQGDLQTILHAKVAHFIHGHWLLQQVDISDLSHVNVSSKHYSDMTWNVMLSPSILKYSFASPFDMSLAKLWEVVNHSNQVVGNDVHYDAVVFWSRIYNPIALILMMFIAIPFGFSSARRSGVGLKIFCGVVVGYGFIVLTNFSNGLAAGLMLPPYVTTALPILVFAIIAAILMNRFN